jgi:hypothetical protein
MALDFPSSPTNGQVYDKYTWDSTKGVWTINSSIVTTMTASDAPPSSPNPGDAWFESSTGSVFVYYSDADSSQWVQATSAYGTSYTQLEYSSPNYVINGAFDIWQRWTGTAFASAGYTADRWAIVAASGQTVSVSQQAFTPGTAPVAGYESSYFCRMAWTGTPSGYFWFTQRVEDVRTLAGQTATLSFWAKAGTATSAFTPVIEQNFGSGGSSVVQTVGTAISLTTSWQRYSVTFNIPSITGKTIGTSSYLDVRPLYSSSTGVSANNIDIWGVQLEYGSTPTTFRRNANSLQGELAACQRYYWRWSATAANTSESVIAQGVFNGTNNARIFMPLPVEMRSGTLSVAQSGIVVGDQTIASATPNSFATDNSRNTTKTVQFVVGWASPTFTTRYPAFIFNSTTSSWIEVSAEL